LALSFLALIHSQAQEPSKRKLLEHPAPPYPALARGMALEGVVKVDALVAPDGNVKDVNVIGGHPVLAQAAAKAVRQWKWEPSAHESHELVQVKFSPPD
jgi:TonB family protein